MSAHAPRAAMRHGLRVPATLLLASLLPSAPLLAQPTFTRVVVDDAPTLGGAPMPAERGADASVFVCRLALSPAARDGLRRSLGHRHAFTRDPEAPGPVIYSLNEWNGIPGDPRLRVEIGGMGLHVLGIGATVAESLAAAAEEPLHSAVLLGTHPEAAAPVPWRRLGDAAARPVVWIREASVAGDRQAGTRREFAFMDVGDRRQGDLHTATGEVGLHDWLAALASGNGGHPEHLQGITVDPDFHVYWSWTDRLVKTDARGRVVAEVEAPDHHGDLCWHDGRVVVAVNHGKFNDPAEAHDSHAYVYDAATLELLERHPLPEARYGAGGICRAGDHWVVVTGLPVELAQVPRAANEVHLYDDAFGHLRTAWLPGGWTRLGIQTATFASGRFVFGCYGSPRVTLVASPDLQHVRRIDGLDCAYGVAAVPGGGLVMASDVRDDEGRHHGSLMLRGVGGLR